MKKHNDPIDEFFRDRLKDYKMEPSDGAKTAFLKDAMQLPPSVKKDRKGLTLLLALIALVGAGIILWTISNDSLTSISEQASSSQAVNRPAAEQKTSFSKTANTDNQNQPQQQPQLQQQQQQQPLQQPQEQQPQLAQQLQQRQNQQQQPQQQQQQQPQQTQKLQQQQAGATGQVKSGQVKSGQVNSDQVNSDQVKGDQVKGDQVKGEQVKGDQMKGDQVKGDQMKGDQMKGDQMKGDQPIVVEPSVKRSLQQPVSSTQTKPQSRNTQESVQPVRDIEPTPQQAFQKDPVAAVPVTPAPAYVTPKGANVNPSIISKAEVSNETDHKSSDGTIVTNLTTGNNTTHATGNNTNLETNNPAGQGMNNPANQVKSEPANQKKTTQERIIQRNWIPDIGIYYTPEWMFNTLEGTKFVNNFGIEGTFHFGRFSIRTGAGLSVGKGTNELVVEYNDFLGSYNKLDSMTFTWNDPTHNYIPTMYLSEKDVWDSLMKLEYARIVKRYTYLHVPMIMGYDFWESDRIVLGVRLGPVMSILLASKQLSEEYEPGKKQILSINAIAPEQVSLNWQVLGGLNASYRLTDVLNIEIEPCLRYYFNSVYEKPANNTKPWSAGVRVAFVVKF